MLQTEKIQAFTALLYTNADFRAVFLNAPVATGTAFGLEEESIWGIYNLPLLEFFARSLLRKRLSIARETLHQLFEVSPKKTEKLFLKYAERNVLRGDLRYLEDALLFCRFLLKENLTSQEREIVKTEIERKLRAVRRNFFSFSMDNKKRIHLYIKVLGKVRLDVVIRVFGIP